MGDDVVLYFSYGSNMDVAGMRHRCPGARPTGIAMLAGWQFFIAACGYASLRRRPGAKTHGVSWRLNEEDLAALDVYEDTAGGLYRRIRLTIQTRVGPRPALVYLTTDVRPGPPHPDYQENIVAAATAWRLPRSARRNLETWLPRRGR